MPRTKSKKTTHSAEELKAQVYDIEKEIFSLRNELSFNRKLEKPHLLKAKRKEKARVLTLLTQMQKSQQGSQQ